MKKIRLLIYALLTMALVFGLDACGDDFDTNDSSDGGTYLVVGNASVARSTISPDAPDLSKLSALVLKGTLTSEDGAAEKTLATADKFADLSGKRISIRTGTWSFTLSAELGGVKFSGTKEGVSIEAGTTNTVAFELVAEDNAGGMSVTVQFPKDENVTKVKATLSKPGDSSFEAKTQEFKKTNALGESDFVLVQDESGAAGSIEKYAVTYSRSISDGNESLADGTYYLVFDFYADGTGDETALNTADYIVRVVRGLVTAATETVSLNETYTIAYEYYANGMEMDEEAALGIALADSAAGYVLPGKFSRKSSTITLPDLAKDGYLWQGWYEDATFTKAVKEIPAGSTGSRNLYAAFINAVTVSENGKSDANVLSGEAVGSVKEAVEKIIGFAANGIDWTIYVDGTVSGAQKILYSADLKVKSLTLMGKNGLDGDGTPRDVLDGGFSAENQGRTLLIERSVKSPITIKCLKVTGGYMDEYNCTGGGISIGYETTVTLGSGLLVTGNTAYNGGGVQILCHDTTVTIEDGVVISNNTASDGGGIMLEPTGSSTTPSVVTMKGGVISGNTQTGSSSSMTGLHGGGGVAMWGGTFIMQGGTITGNTAYWGGGVTVDANSQFILEGGTISDNVAKKFVDKPALTNESARGGGVYISRRAKFTMNGGTIKNNTACWGGGVHADGYSATLGSTYTFYSIFNLTGGTITGNTATEGGSGVFVGSVTYNGELITSTFTMTDGAAVADDNNVYLAEGIAITLAGALTGESPVATITPYDYQSENKVLVLAKDEGGNDITTTTIAAECRKFVVTPDGDTKYQVTSEGRLTELKDVATAVGKIQSMTESGTVELNTEITQSDLVTIVNAMKAKCPEYSSVAPDIMIKLDLSKTTGLTKLNGEFSNTWNLGELVLPEGITTISAVGSRTDYLATMNIPASVTKIDDGAFYRSCASLTIAEGNTSYKIVNKALYTADLTKLVAYANKGDEDGSCEVLASATEIAPWAFSFAKKLKTLTFATPSLLQKIGQEAFDYCDALEDIVLPESVTELGTGVFQYAHVTSMSLPSGLTEIPSSTFSNNDFTRIVIPDGVTTIAGEAFWACGELDSIVLPASVTTIGQSAFGSCNSLAKVYYKGSETDKAGITIGSGNDALDVATWVYESDGPIVLNKGSTVNTTIKKFHDQLVNSGVASISFAKSTTMPSAGTEIAYLDEKGEKVPVWADGSAIYYYKDDDSTIFLNEDSSRMFMNLDTLTSIDVSGFDTSRVQNMSSMFSSCSTLSALNMGEFDTSKVTDMSYMFSYCSALESLDVSTFGTSKVTNMSGMFMYCSALTALNVSKFDTALVTDMSYMFAGCSGLNTLEVANFATYNVTTMRSMFSSCSGLTSLDLSNFLTYSVTSMMNMFEGCSGLTSLNVSSFDTSKVEDMEKMFSGCSRLASIDLENFVTSSVTTVSNMFDECTALVSIDLSNFNMSSIDPDYSLTETFSGCTALASVKLPFAIKIIGDMAFYGCTKLSSIIIPVSVTTIGMNAFKDCSALTTVYYTGTEAQKSGISIDSTGDGNNKLNSATWECNYGN